MNILVTGATGFIGSALIKYLAAQDGFQVTGLVRNTPQPPLGPNVQLLTGDITDIASFAPALTNFDTVIHAAGRAHVLSDDSADPLAAFRQINAEATLQLAHAAAQSGVKRFVFLSSIAVNGTETRPGTAFDHQSPAAPQTPYGRSKYEAEMGLQALCQSSDLDLCCIRPPMVYGASGKGNAQRLLNAIEKGRPLPTAALTRNLKSMVHIDNLVSLIARCVTHPAAAQQTFLVSDDHDLSTRDFVALLGQLTGRKARQIYLPVRLLAGLAALSGKQDELRKLTGNLQIDISHTRKILDWTPPKRF